MKHPLTFPYTKWTMFQFNHGMFSHSLAAHSNKFPCSILTVISNKNLDNSVGIRSVANTNIQDDNHQYHVGTNI